MFYRPFASTTYRSYNRRPTCMPMLFPSQIIWRFWMQLGSRDWWDRVVPKKFSNGEKTVKCPAGLFKKKSQKIHSEYAVYMACIKLGLVVQYESVYRRSDCFCIKGRCRGQSTSVRVVSSVKDFLWLLERSDSGSKTKNKLLLCDGLLNMMRFAFHSRWYSCFKVRVTTGLELKLKARHC